MSNRQKAQAPDVHNAAVMVDGTLVSAEIDRVVRAIREYSPELDVRWIPPAARKPGDAAFAIIHDAPSNDGPYILFYVKDESTMDMRQLHRIIAADQRNGKKKYSDLEAMEEADKRILHQEYLDHLEELHDIAKHVIKSPLNDYKIDAKTRLKDGIPFNVVGTSYE